jgi:hypothetical protein
VTDDASTRTDHPTPTQSPIQVVSAEGGWRVVLVALAVWTLLEGFALATGGLQGLTLGGNDRNAERIIGAQMLIFAPVYVLLAFRREHFRLLTWLPYATLIAIILPTGWGLIRFEGSDGALLFVVSSIFLGLLVYFWWQSHDPDFFSVGGTDTDDEEIDDDAADERGLGPHDGTDQPRRYRRRD